jgi:tRNA(Met) cytidine acetyltransferase
MSLSADRELVWINCTESEVDATIVELSKVTELNPSNGYVIAKQCPSPLRAISPNAVVNHLGESVDFIIFNAFDGFSPNTLAQAAGMIRSAGKLFLITPASAEWPSFKDPELKKVGLDDAVKGLFIPFINNGLNKFYKPISRLNELQRFTTPNIEDRTTDDQINSVVQLLRAWQNDNSTTLITADRGRGKSSSIGIALAKTESINPAKVLITAPDRRSVDSLYSHYHQLADTDRAEHTPRFLRPAEALQALEDEQSDIELLIIDEAAAIATPMLLQLTNKTPHLCLATTTAGYEGFGRGFALRFLDKLKAERNLDQHLTLNEPIRWQSNDPLEQQLNQLLLMDLNSQSVDLPDGIHQIERAQLVEKPELLEALFALLQEAHYRTSPNDLRILLDSPGHLLFVAVNEGMLTGTCWVASEGSIDSDLAEAIARGERRPNGNLLPQTLAFSEGWPQAASNSYWRIIRIAVAEEMRRKGTGAALLKRVEESANELEVDFVGSSFAGFQDVLAFWQANGYSLVRWGDSIDSVAGEAAALVLKELNPAVSPNLAQLTERASQRYQDLFTNKDILELPVGFESVQLKQTDREELISMLTRFAQSFAPLALSKPFIREALRLTNQPMDEINLIEPSNRQEMNQLRERVGELVDQLHSITD